MRKGVLICLFSFLSFSMTYAQYDFDKLLELIKGSPADANLLTEGYVGPVMRGLGSGLNQGWYNTAKTHKTLGIDLTFTSSLMYLPGSDELYLVDNSKLEVIKLVSYDGNQIGPTETASVPTIFGPTKSPRYQIGTTPEFSGPPGLDLKKEIKIADALPAAMFQLGIGLPKNFDLKVRFVPTIAVKNFKFSFWGVGVMHDIGQYIPVVKALPIDISLFAGYTQVKAEQGISGSTGGQNQKGVTEFTATTFQALVSKKISVLTFYGGVGYSISKSNLGMKGTYDLGNGKVAPDPINLDFSTSGMQATGGLRLKLAVFTLHADYTLAEYSALSAGFGINVR